MFVVRNGARFVMSVLVAGSSVVSGCNWSGGATPFLVLTDASATRADDGTVAVEASLWCDDAEGGSGCGAPCVRASWYPRAALLSTASEHDGVLSVDGWPEFDGVPVTHAQTCGDDDLRSGDRETLLVTSSAPIADDEDLVIYVEVQSTQGGPRERTRILVSP